MREETMNRAQHLTAASVAAAALSFAGFTVFPAGAASGNCVTTGTKYQIPSTSRCTTSTSFVTILNSSIAFVQGGSASGCVIASFTSVITTATSAWMTVKATLDGSDPVDPNQGLWRVSVQESRTAVFAFADVAPGDHKITMKFKSSDGQNVCVYNRTTTVSYRK
jgi:hypothetical protein